MNKDRLLQLAEHLDHGVLGHDKFDFRTYNNTREPKCGTAGCAIGECPIVWPNDWEWTIGGEPKVITGYKMFTASPSIMMCAMNWFGVTDNECHHLFFPCEQQTETFGG